MKKSRFYIYGRFGKNGGLGYKVVQGYLFSHDNILFGVHKHDGNWTCTHIKSGLLVPTKVCTTRKSLVDEITSEANRYSEAIKETMTAKNARLIDKMTEQYYKYPIKGMGVFFGIREEG